MSDTDPGWNLYRTFLAVVRDGSFSAAARRIGVTQPTAGRHIEALETVIGTRLFTRSPRGLMPTEAALALVPHAEAMAAAAAALARTSSGEARAERGTVRVTAAELVGCEVLPTILAEFGFRYPGIALELTLSNRNLDLLRRDADIAIRMVRPTQQSLVARRIGSVEVGLFVHRRYAEVYGVPKSAADLPRHRLIGFDRDPHAIQSAGGRAAELRREQFRFRSDSGPAQVAALRAGVGIGGCHVLIARRDPDLLRVLERAFTFRREMWLAMHRDVKATRRVRLLFDHLGEALTAYVRGSPVG